jgi:tetratricopeptide (TPR) repeat protein
VTCSDVIVDRVSKAGIAVRVLMLTSQHRLMQHQPALCVAAFFVAAAVAHVTGQQETSGLVEGARLFYNAQYREAAETAREFLPSSPDEELARDELRASALLFQLRRLLEPANQSRRGTARSLERCPECAELVNAFMTTTVHGQQLARRRLQANATDQTALFFLGKLDLNYVWLQLGPLHRKTGWNEYWEARRSLDAVLKVNPRHVRARVARAWIDYIVDTKIPWGVRWVLGGGDKKNALGALREAAAADADADFFAHAEAVFGLWDMLVRERHVPEAIEVAERLATMFPGNPEVATFLEARRR